MYNCPQGSNVNRDTMKDTRLSNIVGGWLLEVAYILKDIDGIVSK